MASFLPKFMLKFNHHWQCWECFKR
jgi:hypothetical protein